MADCPQFQHQYRQFYINLSYSCVTYIESTERSPVSELQYTPPIIVTASLMNMQYT